MEVGDVAETVTVEAGVPLVESESSVIGQVIGERQVQETPLNGRNVMNLVSAPGQIFARGQELPVDFIIANNGRESRAFHAKGGGGSASPEFESRQQSSMKFSKSGAVEPKAHSRPVYCDVDDRHLETTADVDDSVTETDGA